MIASSFAQAMLGQIMSNKQAVRIVRLRFMSPP
jgi:hypothetical protein